MEFQYMPEHYLLRVGYLIFINVHLIRCQPAERTKSAIVRADTASAKGAVNKLERIISIHAGEQGEFEGGFIFSFVHTGRAHILAVPRRITTQGNMDSGIDLTHDFQVRVVRSRQLLCERCSVSSLSVETLDCGVNTGGGFTW